MQNNFAHSHLWAEVNELATTKEVLSCVLCGVLKMTGETTSPERQKELEKTLAIQNFIGDDGGNVWAD